MRRNWLGMNWNYPRIQPPVRRIWSRSRAVRTHMAWSRLPGARPHWGRGKLLCLQAQTVETQFQGVVQTLCDYDHRIAGGAMRLLVAVLFFMISGCIEAFSCWCMGPVEAKTMREVAAWYAKQPDVALIFEGRVTKQ